MVCSRYGACRVSTTITSVPDQNTRRALKVIILCLRPWHGQCIFQLSAGIVASFWAGHPPPAGSVPPYPFGRELNFNRLACEMGYFSILIAGLLSDPELRLARCKFVLHSPHCHRAKTSNQDSLFLIHSSFPPTIIPYSLFIVHSSQPLFPIPYSFFIPPNNYSLFLIHSSFSALISLIHALVFFL
jgi:hypothetical protein